MIVGLDSATPPTSAQANAAKAAGIGMWAGYVSEIPQRDGLYHPWTPAEFDVVRVINPHPIAYTSGWDDPVAARNDAANRGYRLCLDVERLIRDDGPWVQAWLDASGAGLYGVRSVHVGRRAAFHIAAWYPGYDPKAAWPPSWPAPSTPCAWQWRNSHPELGVTVDRNYLDDWFAPSPIQEVDMTPEESVKLDQLWRATFGIINPGDPASSPHGIPADIKAELDALKAEVAALKGQSGSAPSYQGTVSITLAPK